MLGIKITGNADPKEAQAYADYLQKKYNRKLVSLDIQIDGEYANLDYKFEHKPFERIRRITGYLTGDVKGWNRGKTAELGDRRPHGLPQSELEELKGEE